MKSFFAALPKLASSPPFSEVWGGVPFGAEALLVEPLGAPLCWVLKDNEQLLEAARALAFFSPDLSVLTFPAWDTLPYDRVSPSKEIMGQRLKTLEALSWGPPAVVLTTVMALVQKVPDASLFTPSISLVLTCGQSLSMEALKQFLVKSGYVAVETVRERGEFSLRGGLLDVFPSTAPLPWRLDFFGEELEQMRAFDPLSQRTVEMLGSGTLYPATEVLWQAETPQRFRGNYIQAFGRQTSQDGLVEAISHGIKPLGYEQWLPFFYETLVPFWTFLSPQTLWLVQEDTSLIHGHFMEQVTEHYKGRMDSGYGPVPPTSFYVSLLEMETYLQTQKVLTLTPYTREGAFSWGGKKIGVNNPPDLEGRSIVVTLSEGHQHKVKTLLEAEGRTVSVVSSWKNALKKSGPSTALVVGPLTQGFVFPGLTVVTEQELYGNKMMGEGKKTAPKAFKLDLGSFEIGDYLVHEDHGIGLFRGLVALDVGGETFDFIHLEYEGGDKLYVPAQNLELISKYGGSQSLVTLDKLGSIQFQKRKAVVKKRIRDMAGVLLKMAAERSLEKGVPIAFQQEVFETFCESFPYIETDDQLRAIQDVLEDLLGDKPMDRLICGDVGFGKTEVALRAAFVAATSGYQVAVVVPTTILCRQHYKNFEKRLSPFGIKVGFLSRMATKSMDTATRKELASGELKILISTHAVFSKKIAFHNLGLVVLDEEQHFGVSQKERLKSLQPNVHLLSMSATPIPRTLQMAISGVRDLSLIQTPPLDRMAVKAFVMPFDPLLIKEAILREYHRGGQVYCVCPRIADLDHMEEVLRALVPEISMIQAHGQMAPQVLDQAMQDFYDKKYTVLLSTNIVESGLDVPSANTLIVHRADMFGLSQLYQLRGRIGRSKVRGYAYFLLPTDRLLRETAQRRLDVIQSLDTLGAGFIVASSDMDIRGAGNLVGEEQSGHIKEVGLELYQSMLNDMIEELKTPTSAEEESPRFSPQLTLGASVLLPDTYVPDLSLRIGLYRRLSDVDSPEGLLDFEQELIDRFGPLPEVAHHLFQVMGLKIQAKKCFVERLEVGPKGVMIKFYKDYFPGAEKLLAYVQQHAGLFKWRTDQRLILLRTFENFEATVKGLTHFLNTLIDML